MRINSAKKKMLAGKPAIGMAVGYGSPLIAEDLSLLGFDYILIDNQHGAWSTDSTLAAIRGVLLGSAIPMVRVQQNQFGAIGKALDQGALGVIVPMVNTVEEAEAAAYAARYVPRGGRSMGPFGTRVLGSDYAKEANDEVFLAVQIESQQALDNVEEIMAVDGVDGCWIGPTDLALSMGIDPTTPEGAKAHESAILRILEACKKTNKIPGIYGNAGYWVKRGFLFVTCGVDSDYIIAGAKQELEKVNRTLESSEDLC